jgi:hypothetical protein
MTPFSLQRRTTVEDIEPRTGVDPIQALRQIDRPELISTELPKDFVDNQSNER